MHVASRFHAASAATCRQFMVTDYAAMKAGARPHGPGPPNRLRLLHSRAEDKGPGSATHSDRIPGAYKRKSVASRLSFSRRTTRYAVCRAEHPLCRAAASVMAKKPESGPGASSPLTSFRGEKDSASRIVRGKPVN